MLVAVVVAELQLPGIRRARDKRKVVQGLVERLHARLRVSAAAEEIDETDERARLGIAIVHPSERELERLLELVRQLLETHADAFLVGWEPDILEIDAAS